MNAPIWDSDPVIHINERTKILSTLAIWPIVCWAKVKNCRTKKETAGWFSRPFQVIWHHVSPFYGDIPIDLG